MSETPYTVPAPLLAIVVPCYNEQDALPATAKVLLGLLDSYRSDGLVASDSYVLCVDDGSTDGTRAVIEELHAADARIKGLFLAHNRGHQYALLAGLMAVRSRCDAAVSMDADLQDDPAAMGEMLSLYRQGYEIVYGVRSSRRSDTFFKRTTAHAFYSFQRKMGLETIYDHADYRLMSSRALDCLAEYGEQNIYLRGIIPQIGLRHTYVYYERASRVAGESKYPLKKMLMLSADGITSFSARPMRWIFMVGLITFVLTLVVAVYVLISYFFRGDTNPGWTSIMLSVWGLGSLILMAIGIVGEYIGKIFVEVKGRPRYTVDRELW